MEKLITTPIHIKRVCITPSNMTYYKYVIVREVNGEYYFYDFAETEEDKSFCHKEPFRGILTGAALFKKEVFDIIGFFDESIITATKTAMPDAKADEEAVAYLEKAIEKLDAIPTAI